MELCYYREIDGVEIRMRVLIYFTRVNVTRECTLARTTDQIVEEQFTEYVDSIECDRDENVIFRWVCSKNVIQAQRNKV